MKIVVKKDEFKKFKTFTILFVGTILLYRIWVFIVQDLSFRVGSYEGHHLHLGMLIIILSAFSRFFSKNKKANRINLALFAIGSGMVVDEFFFLFFTKGTHEDYFSLTSVLGTILMTVFLILFFYKIYKWEKIK